MGSFKLKTQPDTIKFGKMPIILTLITFCVINWSVLTSGAPSNGADGLPKKIIYLTFDDGPNQGTSLVLDVLKKHKVPATFFINSINLDGTTINQDVSHKMILRIVQEGHTLADHSYDHLKHNNYDNQQNYKNLYTDLDYFGEKNSKPVLDILRKSSASHAADYVKYTMNTFVRLPYTNAWRVNNIKADCPSCTVPASSGQIAIQVGDSLAGAGKYVFGWDQEWDTNYAINRVQHSGGDMYRKLKLDKTKSPRKLVLLMHDYAFRPSQSAEFDVAELDNFITSAKHNGYTFSTIDKYLQDNISSVRHL